jgi:integrase
LDATADDDLCPLYALAATTGLRRAELLRLTWADVGDGRVTVRRAMGRVKIKGWRGPSIVAAEATIRAWCRRCSP